MDFPTFKSYCEALDATTAYSPSSHANGDATSGYSPNAESGYISNKPFVDTVKPLISSFVAKIKSLLDQDNLQIHPPQIEHIVDEIRQHLSNLRYSPHEDLRGAISHLFKKRWS